MNLPQVRPSQYLLVARLCLGSLVAIIVTGSLVRLTGSGLGCADWPKCSATRFVDVSSSHAAIEQVNRLFTGVVAAAVGAATLLSLRLKPRDKRLVRLSLGLVGGVVAQVLLGAVVVLSGLHPLFNMAHYLVSIGLVTVAYRLVVSSREASGSQTGTSLQITDRTLTLARLFLLGVFAVLLLGTVVTGSGPHAGDESAPRFDFVVGEVARIHSAAVWITLFVLVALVLNVRKSKAIFAVIGKQLEVAVALIIAQGALGYLQYFLGVPALLVAIHVALSVAVWISALAVIARLSDSYA